MSENIYSKQLKIYVCSKLRHAELLRKLRQDRVHFNARWIETGNLAFNETKPVSHWLEENFDDIRACDFIFVYGEEGEHLKTAIGEAFYGIAHGKEVWVIGEHPDYHPWCYYTQMVHRAPTFEVALAEVKARVFGKPAELERGTKAHG